MSDFSDGIPVSAFAALCGVSRQTLIYYDRIGLFHPARTDGKGYRYYLLSQQEEFSLINLLAELGTPLAGIREYLEHKSPAAFTALLEQKGRAVDEKIRRLESIARLIDDRKKTAVEAMEITDPEAVSIDYEPAEHLILSRPVRTDDPDELSKIVGEFERLLRTKNIEAFGFGAIIDQSDLREPFRYRIANFYVKTPSAVDASFTRPPGYYASTCHRGPYPEISESYSRLLGRLESGGRSIAGNAYERDLLSSYTVMSEADYLTRISIRVL